MNRHATILKTLMIPLCLVLLVNSGLYLHPVLGASNPVEEFDEEAVREATALLHTTGTPQEVDIRRWRLKVRGEGVKKTVRLTYRKLAEMETVTANVALVCPGAFSDRADWEGVPLQAVLDIAQVRAEYETIIVAGLDGYSNSFTREEVEEHLIFLALRVNGVTLPKEHGFPVRIVAEDLLGGKWVKWIDYIEVY
jgi:sulfoxide reductase catalytic subunit YedY